MWGFISFVFWLAVFLLGGLLFVAVLLDSTEEGIETDKKKKKLLWDSTSIEHINSWETYGYLLACYLVTLLGAWGIDFLYPFLWLCLFALIGFAFTLLSAAGLDSEDLPGSIKKQIEHFNIEKMKAYLPTYSLVASFSFILLFNLGGMLAYDKNQSSGTKSGASSSSTQSSTVSWTLSSDGCPRRNGDLFGNSPGQVAGRIFDISAARGQSVTSAYNTCIQCIRSQFFEAQRKYGTTGSVSSPQVQYCERLLDTFISNRTVWQQMQQEKKYR
jgi:hypothetical protein